MSGSYLKKFFFPQITRGYLLRVAVVTVAAVMMFKYVLIPFRVQGESMAPTYSTGSFNFCFALRYMFSGPVWPDVVAVKLAGRKVMLLKRVVATEGQRVEFRAGRLFVDGQMVDEPYISRPGDWNIAPVTVKPGYVYVVGDNRGVPAERHVFGQTPVKRIAGAPVW